MTWVCTRCGEEIRDREELESHRCDRQAHILWKDTKEDS